MVELDDPVVGRVRQVGPLANMSDTPARIERSAPALGADTAAVLAAPRVRTSPPVPPDVPAPGPHALSGVTIVELAYYVAAPLASTLLAEMGARVIKVEPLAGDPARRTGLQNAKFLVGKESIALDLKSEEGRAILQQLIGGADALLHSFRKGVPERLGHDYETAIALNPRLVYVYGGSYGSRGPWNMRPAFHSTPNALCGGGFAQAGLGNPPADDSYPDPGSGIATATASMLGLWARESTGQRAVRRDEHDLERRLHPLRRPRALRGTSAARAGPTRASTACTRCTGSTRSATTGCSWPRGGTTSGARWRARSIIPSGSTTRGSRSSAARTEHDDDLVAAISAALATRARSTSGKHAWSRPTWRRCA